ncbi:MAG: sigma-70 family RNA polymerase sigma factor, partial [Candidatus Binatia bacterium]
AGPDAGRLAPEMTETGSELRRTHARLIARLHGRANAARWGVSEEELAAALERSAAGAPAGGLEGHLESLHVEDLALACACERGSPAAWEHVVTQYRPLLYRAARALLRDESRAREVADSLWADLYGLEKRDGRRRSLFRYFHGRSSLAGWLRALVARRHIDVRRADRRREALDEDDPPEPLAGSTPGPERSDPDRPRYVACLQRALTKTIAALEPRERLRLSCYHLQEMTLAEIGRLFGEHESTVSRKLDRLRREIRKQVERALRRDEGLSDEQIRLCYEYAREEWPYDLRQALSGAP